jgi:hypothetical protein
MELIKDNAELTKAIDAWGAQGTKWTTRGQLLALSALQYLADHRDTGAVNRLYKAMPKGTKSSAMASFLLTHGALSANTDKGTKADQPFKFDKEKATDVDAAKADPWFDHKPEPDADQVFDLQKAIKAIIAKAAKSKQLSHAELLTGLNALVTAGQPVEPAAAPTEGEKTEETPAGETQAE